MGRRAQDPLRGWAYWGSWIGNRGGVRDRCPSGVASRERCAAGDRAWARALTEAQAELAAEGGHLADQGDVLSSPPRAEWAWEEDSAEVPQVQRATAEAVKMAMSGTLTPREALDQAAEEVDEILEDY